MIGSCGGDYEDYKTQRTMSHIIIKYFFIPQLTYLVAFSCELSRILDSRRTSIDSASILLCIIYFVLFLSATILINGLATRLAMGLLIWSVIVSTLTIPELWLIMVQFWVKNNCLKI